ncbi:MAG: pyridoxamine 5'-phosphate oxidase family protein [Clostridia bacterium]
MNEAEHVKALEIMKERFGHDTVLALATVENDIPSVRMVNGYYEDGSFYVITHALTHKTKQIQAHPVVGICGEWFTAHGVGCSMGHVCAPCNAVQAAKLREAFKEWYDNGHTDESDIHTCILRVRLTDAVLLSHGKRFELVF